jgi:hypothetical protein
MIPGAEIENQCGLGGGTHREDCSRDVTEIAAVWCDDAIVVIIVNRVIHQFGRS